jgi:hypothetical protein
MNMKRLMMFIAFMIMILPIMSCRKDAPEINQNMMVLSSELWSPGVIYFDDENWYWIDPTLYQEPVAPEEIIKGPKNLQGWKTTIEQKDPETGYITYTEILECPANGDNCGRVYRVINGITTHVGYYLSK